MKVIHTLICLLFCLHADVYSLEIQWLKGFVFDVVSGLPLRGVQVSGASSATVSDSSGSFSAEVAGFPVVFSFSLTGYPEEKAFLNAPIDTVLRIGLTPKMFTLEEVVVTSTRLSQTISSSPSSIRLVDKLHIERTSAATLADLLMPVEGLFVKNYGGGSGVKTLSQRGMGTEHTLILLNGMRISNSQNGLVDLGLLPVDGIDRIELIRGGQSASFGADAVAGVINVVPEPVPSQGTIRAASTVGSFGYRRYQLSGGYSSGGAGIRLHYGEEESDEDFGFRFSNGNTVSELHRQNSDLAARFGNLIASFAVADGMDVHTFVSVYRSERGVGGPVVGPSSSSKARQTDKDDIFQVGFRSNLSAVSSVSIHAQLRNAYQRYRDPDLSIANVILDNYFRNQEVRLEPKVEMEISDAFRLAGGADLAHITSDGNSMKSSQQRRQLGVYATAEQRFRLEGGPLAEIALFPAVRYDVTDADMRAVSPQFGALAAFRELNAGSVKHVKAALRASIARNFRPPTFNELYFSGGGGVGNPGLQPERSTSFDAGANVSWSLFGEHSLQGTYFLNTMSGRIVWVAAGSGSVTPKNLRSVRAEGFEGSYRWSLPGNIAFLELNYTNADSRKTSADYPGDPAVNARLIYIPRESFNAAVSVEQEFDATVFRQVGWTFTHSFVGYRYYTEDNTGFLPSYRVASMNIRTRLTFSPFTGFIKGEINNLFNEEYQVIIGYPMPGRSFRVTVGAEY